MASLTVRQLDERLKTLLRLRAARNGRSMEDEIRIILREAADAAGDDILERFEPPAAKAPAAAAASAATGQPRVLLIIGGGIAAYKSLDLIRRLKERGCAVRCILTKAATEFVTPLAAGALVGGRVHTDLFNPDHEFDVGHIRLAREADLVVVAPATADLMAKMAQGLANDLATAVLLATTAKILLAPAMNPAMWANKATQRNLKQLKADGVALIGPNAGEMAERGERGLGRMAEPLEIAGAAERMLKADNAPLPLKGKRILITAGPTHEPIDPVRYIANRSSGKQGYAIAAAAAQAGADVVLVSGPVNLRKPDHVDVIDVESARDMLAAVEKALTAQAKPVDVAILAAAVADWRVANAGEQKIKKQPGAATPQLALAENPDILSTIAHRGEGRPPLVIGFAAETENVIANAKAKLAKKGCDWILANDVSPSTGIMGGDSNTLHLVTKAGVDDWPPQSKEEAAAMLISRIAATLTGDSN